MSAILSLAIRRGDIIAASTLIVLASALVWTALRMPLGTAVEPGPGVLPAALGVLLLVTSCGLLVRALRLSGEQASERIALGHGHIWLVLVALIAVAFALEPLGYIPTLALFLAVLLRRFSGRGSVHAIVWAVVITLASYYFFSTLLGVTLPQGVLRLN